MKKLFPQMMNTLETGHIIGILTYWVVAFVVLPFLLPVAALGLWEDVRFTSWLEIGYHSINGIVLGAFMKEHLQDAWFFVQLDRRSFWSHVAVTVGLMVAAVLLQIILMPVSGLYSMTNAFPMVEMGVALTPGYLATVNPVFGTACMVLLGPLSVCGLFYATGFAPVCVRAPWLAYLNVVLITLLPVLFDIFWRGDAMMVFDMYLMQLPVHLIACWSYQKTDNIWTPILSLSALNLLTALVNILIG